MSALTVALIVANEEEMLGAALRSAAFADEVLVVDSGSSDGTVALAEAAGARVVTRAFDNFSAQRNFALEQAAGEWVFFLDADERIPRALAEELRRVVSAPTAEVYRVPRRSMALGRWLDWHPGGPDAPPRLMRRETVRWTGLVHEVIDGEHATEVLEEQMVHLTHRTVSALVQKIDAYSEHEAQQLLERGANPPSSARELLGSFAKASKELLRSGLRREGMQGAVEAFLLAFNRTLVLAKLWERSHEATIADAYRSAEDQIEVASPRGQGAEDGD